MIAASVSSTATSIGEPVPALSVVIASVNGWDLLGPTLRALDAQENRSQLEIVVVDAVGGDTRSQIRAHRPGVELIAMDDRVSIPKLRHVGVRHARGSIIAIIEDHGEVDPAWAAAILKAHESPCGAVGGAVENGRSGLVNWAVYFTEYAAYMGPVIEGPALDLPGNNIAYKRPHLLRHAHVLDEGKWESWINDRLRLDGVSLVSTNSAVIRHIKPFQLGYFVAQRFHFARSYAGMRRGDQSWPLRLIYGAGSTLLPVVLLARVTRTVLRKRRHLPKFAACLPLVAFFLTIGALGEMVGYVLGAGMSLSKVE